LNKRPAPNVFFKEAIERGYKGVSNEHRDDRSNSGKNLRLRPNIIEEN